MNITINHKYTPSLYSFFIAGNYALGDKIKKISTLGENRIAIFEVKQREYDKHEFLTF